MKGKPFVIANIDEHLNRTHTFYEDYIHTFTIKYIIKQTSLN